MSSGSARITRISPSRSARLRWSRLVDPGLVGLLTVWAQAELLVPALRTSSLGAPMIAAVPLSLAMTLPLLLRRRAPLVVALLVAGAFALETVLWKAPDNAPHIAAILVAVYSLAAFSAWPAAVGGLLATVALLLTDLDQPADAAFIAILVVVPWLGGRLVRGRQALVLQLRRRTAELEREREANARLAAATERVRIARELHDVLAHNVTAMVVEAEAAGQLLGRHPERSAAWLDSIANTGRATLEEMRRVVAVLRADDDAQATPPLRTRLEEILGRARSSGVDVTLHLDGGLGALPADVELTVLRVVQEAVTNIARHVGPCDAQVRLGLRDGRLCLAVTDGGTAVPRPRSSGGGYGLVGMRERVEAQGGLFHAGPAPGGGFAVRAELPLRESA